MLGVLMLQTRFPRPLGDIGHPQSLPFVVRHQVVQGATPQTVVRAPGAPGAPGAPRALGIAPFVQAAQQLVAEGAQAITTSCGFLALWQRELQAALPVPVWSSALLQLAQPAASPRRCGVITIEAAALTPAHLQAVAADPATPVEGITPGSPLHRTLLLDLPQLDMQDAQQQVLAAGQRLLQRHPGVNTIVLECTNLPPYAAALRLASGLPVLDILSLLHERGRACGLALVQPGPGSAPITA
jgi:aspartate/glutamate racemase